MLRKTAMMTAALLTLSACGGGSLPSSCKDALKDYAKLEPEQREQVESRFILNIMMDQGNGDAATAIEQWEKQVEAEYEAISKMQGSKSADLLIEQTETTCQSWQKEIDAVQ